MKYSVGETKQIIYKKNIQNFNDLGGASMYEYKIFSDDNLNSDQQDVLEKLSEIDKKYSLEEFIPKEITSLGLEKKEFEAPTDEEVRLQAENLLESEKENGLKKIQDNYDSKFSSLDSKSSSGKLTGSVPSSPPRQPKTIILDGKHLSSAVENEDEKNLIPARAIGLSNEKSITIG